MPMRIALLTSGGDAPGMNAAIRSAVRVAKDRGWTVFGIKRGYEGLLAGELDEMTARSVSNMIQRGGTILQSSRSPAFMTLEGQKKAAQVLSDFKINGLIVIGGNGSFKGAFELSKSWPGQIVGIPGTIDNDLYGTDYTIGFDTAVNTALEAIDRIRDTADAHERIFVVEVMGRNAGFIALEASIASGAEEVLLPEVAVDLKNVYERLQAGRERGKTSSIIVVAEGSQQGGAFDVAHNLHEKWGCECRVVVLGHIQRGGSPSATDRVLATKLGSYAIDVLEAQHTLVMVGEVRGSLVITPLEKTWLMQKPLDAYLFRLGHVLES